MLERSVSDGCETELGGSEIAEVISGLEENDDVSSAIVENVPFGEIARDAVASEGDNAIKTAAWALVEKIIADRDISEDETTTEDVLNQVDWKKLADDALESPEVKAKLAKKVMVYLKKHVDSGDADDTLNEVINFDSDDVKRILGEEGMAEVDAELKRLVVDYARQYELSDDDENEISNTAFSLERIAELAGSDEDVKSTARQKILSYIEGLDASQLEILEALREALFTDDRIAQIIEEEKHTIDPKLRGAVSTAVTELTDHEATATIKSRLLQSEGFGKAIDLSMERLAGSGKLDQLVLTVVDKLMSDDSSRGMRSQVAEKIGDRFLERIAGKFVDMMLTRPRT